MNLLNQDTRAIIVADNGLMNFFLRINHVPNGQEWKIQNIEVYTTFEAAQAGRTFGLVADDVQFATLPEATKMAVYAALDEHAHKRREAMNRLNIELASLKRNELSALL